MEFRIKNIFGQRNYKSNSKKYFKIYIIAVEGNKTEVDYFKGFQTYQKELNIRTDVLIEPLEREDTKSAPKHVLELLKEYDARKIENNLQLIVKDKDISSLGTNIHILVDKIISNI
ncbi:MAG: RloB domain-containing protein [Nanoarchaeota archaeon]|nr:RloB domain-containing protein [Nanoarchaeota archaeon]